jgi:hypothetical protein
MRLTQNSAISIHMKNLTIVRGALSKLYERGKGWMFPDAEKLKTLSQPTPSPAEWSGSGKESQLESKPFPKT